MASTSTTTLSYEDHHFNTGSQTSVIPLRPVSNAQSDAVEESPPAHAVAALPDGGYGWTVVGSCAFLLFLMNGYNTAWGVLQTALLLEQPALHGDVRTVTFIGSLNLGILVAFGATSVRLMRSYGTRVPCALATIIYGLGLILSGFTINNIGGLFMTAGAMVGISTSLMFAATNSMPLHYFSRRLGMANGLVKAGGGLGATILPVVAQALIDKIGIPWTFRTLGFIAIVTGLPCSLLLKDNTSARNASRFDWSLLKNPAFLALTLAGAIGVFALFVPPFFIPLFANSIGLSASTGAALVAGFGASTTFGRLISGWLCDRMGAFNTLAVAAFVNSITMWAIWPFSSSLAPLMIFAIINGIANGSFFVALPTAIAAITPGSAASAISMAVMFWTPGYLLGSPIAGMLIQATGAEQSSTIKPYRAAIFYAAGTGLAATILVVYSRMKLDKKLIKKL